MFYDVSFLWIWLVLAVVVGAVVGWRTEEPGPQTPWFHGWFQKAAIALAVGFVASVLHFLPGRLAFLVESAVLFFAAYLVGCLIGGALLRMRTAN